MTRSGQLVRVRRLIEAFNGHSAEEVTTFLASNISWRRGDGRTLEGWEAVGARLHEFFTAFPDAVLLPTRIHPFVPNTVLIEWILEGTHVGHWRPIPGARLLPPSGKRIRMVGADLVGFNPSGEIAWVDARNDTAALIEQISSKPDAEVDPAKVKELADQYTAAWCSQNPRLVAEFFTENGILRINGDAPAVGRDAIVAAAAGFMVAFPDLIVRLDSLLIDGNHAVYRWTLTGTNNGPGGSGRSVRVSGFEVWTLTSEPRIADSYGHFDSAAYRLQREGPGPKGERE